MTEFEIEAFHALIKYQSFSQAAQSLFITQPALSKRLQTLEHKLGCKLFIRSKGLKRIELTQYGEAFISLASRWRDLYSETKNLKYPKKNQTFTVSALDGIHTCLLAEPYQNFATKSENITIDMKITHSKDSYFFVEQGLVDIGFIAECQLSKNTMLFPILKEQMFFISNNNSYPNSVIDPTTLDMSKCIYGQWNFEIDTWFNTIFDSSKKPVAIIENMVVLGKLLEINDYWSIVPASIAEYLKDSKMISVKPLSSPAPDRIIYGIINLHKANKELICSFLDAVHNYVLKSFGVESLLTESTFEELNRLDSYR